MSASLRAPDVGDNQAVAQITVACERIAPSWPLDRWIAVNPWWGHRYQSVEDAANELAVRGGQGMLMAPAFYMDAWQGGRVSEQDLLAAAREQGVDRPVDTLIEELHHLRPQAGKPVLVLAFREGSGNCSLLAETTQHLGQLCGRFFDRRQGQWLVNTKGTDLYRYWLSQAVPRSLDSKKVKALLPDDWRSAASFLAQALPVTSEQLAGVVHALLLQLPGWAAWCRGEDWRAGLEGKPSYLCHQLATVLLACEWMAASALSANQYGQCQQEGTGAELGRRVRGDNALMWVWHRAYEMAWQRRFADSLPGPAERPEESHGRTPEVQAAFCIDVRSEVLRRHLERGSRKIDTLGVAGFFGLPVAHQKLGPADDEARLPGLLAPAFRYVDTLGDSAADRVRNRQLDGREQVRETVRQAKYGSLSTFTLVETTGLAWAWKLVRDGLQKNRKNKAEVSDGRLFHRYGGDPLSDSERVNLAEGLLKSMSLTGNFAPLLVLVGHGAHTDNNPNQAGLACGACGGKNGDVNASIAAQLLNDRSVRAGLAERGIIVPESTLVVAAEHCTVTDQVRLLGEKAIPASHERIARELLQSFDSASAATRRERAATLGLNGHSDEALLKELIKRTHNWAEIRPEWGLANNAAMIIAPRHRSRAINLAGRCFLHEYRPELDDTGSVLSSLMSAPMVVANWINLQYFGSVTQPSRYGAGNKLLHSVVGGNIGVLEGNGTDLRIGLPWQSVHDGERLRHEPMRLTVVIDAPAERIEQVLQAQDDVRALVENRWLWLWRMDDSGLQQYSDGRWMAA
ncbi:YbcC family protein [Marinobacter shengliensis]|uniref:YbcC family protein n=1 Tax=Marinobacter shengliensis TaxID=1389223 RepID=UPI0035BB8E8A